MKTKTFVITVFFIIILLSICLFFPAEGIFQQIITAAAFFVVIPILFNKFILKRSLAELGLQVGDWKKGLVWCGVAAIVLAVIFFIIIYFFNFTEEYVMLVLITDSFWKFVFYEMTVVLFIVFICEFFFRGFVMFALEPKIQYWAIIIQAVVFVFLAIILEGATMALVPYILFAPFAGIIAQKSRSIFYSGALQFLIIIILDAATIHALMR